MANRPHQLAQFPLRSYSRTEFTALRARERPADRDDRAVVLRRDADDRVDVAQLLRTMRDDLVAAALRDGSPVLAGNPWQAVTDPNVVRRIRKLQVERALSLDLWTRVRASLAERSELQGPTGPRWRAARAVAGNGDGGLRIAEAAGVTRAALTWLPADDDTPASWLLEVIGKGNKQRFVPINGFVQQDRSAFGC
ncbi:hypothetical protein [Burkholderia sp. GS2Y]|uniref:Uncharacterized protein n=1 Tax=Burkholderia theae TaxID=3143496 RepID=A0ABU9WR67_9BURK